MYHSFQKEMFYTMKPNYATFLNGKVKKKHAVPFLGLPFFNRRIILGGRAATLTAVDDCDFHQRDFLWVSIEGRGAGRYGE